MCIIPREIVDQIDQNYIRFLNQNIAEEYKTYWIHPSYVLEHLSNFKIQINRALGVPDKLIASDYIGLPMGDNIHANLKEINKRINHE